MSSIDSFQARGSLTVSTSSGERTYEIFRIGAVTGSDRLPFSHKVLLENLLRTEDGANVTAEAIAALGQWQPDAEPSTEIQFTPARVVMQDFTGVPVVVDLATMREAVKDLGGTHRRSSRWLLQSSSLTTLSSPTFRTSRCGNTQRGIGVREEPRALSVPAVGTGSVRGVQSRSARNGDRSPGQHRGTGAGDHGAWDQACGLLWGRIPRHHGQRSRSWVGALAVSRRRRRARSAGLDAHPEGGGIQTHRKLPPSQRPPTWS